ncbi:MAG: hypothetical protein N3F04_06580 [Candidatus Nezhaarchaeota archaeon]|nr:hypothetical protein [Candidatus Nezhaarchaeota archaeon]
MEILGLVSKRRKIGKEDFYRKLIYGKGAIYGIDRDVLANAINNLAIEISSTPFGLACKALSTTAKRDIGSIVVLSEVKPLAKELRELLVMTGLAADDILDLPYAKDIFITKKAKRSVVYGHLRSTTECFLLSNIIRGEIPQPLSDRIVEAALMTQSAIVKAVDKASREGATVWSVAWNALSSVKPLAEMQSLPLMLSALPYAAQQAKLTAAYMYMKKRLQIDIDTLLAQSIIKPK